MRCRCGFVARGGPAHLSNHIRFYERTPGNATRHAAIPFTPKTKEKPT